MRRWRMRSTPRDRESNRTLLFGNGESLFLPMKHQPARGDRNSPTPRMTTEKARTTAPK